jgi:hypothetical protein
MDMALRPLPPRRRRRKQPERFHFPQIATLCPQKGFKVLWGFVHPNIETQRLFAVVQVR